MASSRPPDKVLKNPLLTSADQNAFFEEFAHSRLLVAPPAPLPLSTPVSGHVSSVGQDAAATEIRGPTLTPNLQVQDSGKDPSSDQSFTEIPLTLGFNISAAPVHPVSSAAQLPVGPPPVSSGPPPSTGFNRSALLTRYIPSNFIPTSLPTPALLQIFQGAPSAPVGVSLLNPTQVEQPDETVAASPENSVQESSQAPVPTSPPLQNPSVLNVQQVPDIPEPFQHLTPVSHPSTAHSTALPSAFQQAPHSSVLSSSPQTSNPPTGFTVYSQPLNQPLNANPSVSSPASAATPASNIVHLTKATSIPGFPASSNFSNSVPTLPSSKSTDFPFVPVFPKPNSGNFVPNFPLNLVNDNPITTGLVPPQLRSSPSPLSSKHSTPPPGSQTPLLLSAERGSPSIIQAPNNSSRIEPHQVPVSHSPQVAPPIESVSPGLVGPPPQVGPPPRGNSSAYPSALSRSAVNRSGLGHHSSSSLRQSTTPKAVSESQITFFTPAPVDNAFPPTLDQPQLGSFISESNQLTEAEKPKSFLSSAASYFSLSGDSNSVQQPQSDTGFYQSVNQQIIPPPSLAYSSSGATYPTTTSQSGNNFPPTVPASSSYFQPALPTSQSSSQFFQDPTPSGNPSSLFAAPSVASAPPIPTGQPPLLQNQSRPSSVGSVSSLQSAGSFPPVTSPLSSNSQKPFSHLISTSYFTPISESNNQESSSPARSLTSSQGSLSSTHHPSYTNPSLPETSNQPVSYYNPTHFTTPPSQVFNPATPAYPPYSASPPDTTNLSSPISVPSTGGPKTGQSVISFDNISASFSQSPNTSTNDLGFSAFSTDIPPQSSVSASSFFQSASSSTQTSAVESSPLPSSLQQAAETRSPTFPTSQVDSSTYTGITPSNTPPPTYGSLDTRDPITNPNCNVDDSASSATDGRPLGPSSEGQTPYCDPRPTSLPPASSNQGNTYRRTSLKRPSYVPVADLGVSHPSTELMGQSQQFPGSGTMQEEPPKALTSDGDRDQSSSPPSPAGHSQSMDFSSRVVPSVGHYRPVFHHWFFKKDTSRAIWEPFSMADSLNIEQAFVSPEISEATKVPTDGGRYDVEVLCRKKTAVYWEEAPCKVRRCSWFVKSPSEARYIPYDENIAEFLEEEYRQGCLHNEWNRRIELADGEVIILQSPNAMAHNRRSTSPDDWGNSPDSYPELSTQLKLSFTYLVEESVVTSWLGIGGERFRCKDIIIIGEPTA